VDLFTFLVALVSVAAGAVASVAGFGIGSLLTPLLALEIGTKAAVAAVSVPHAAGTALRFWLLRRHVDWSVMWSFGVTSAAGGLAGALAYEASGNRALGAVFGALLLFAAIGEYTGLMRRVRFGRGSAYAAGGLSGFFGGLVGNQGGIRAAALLGFKVRQEAFVATATAIALVVDAARMPVYFAGTSDASRLPWSLVAIGTAGVIAGTVIGERVLGRIPPLIFRRTVATIVGLLGLSFLWRAFS
jgi:uncharacterized membrane protein YfcA